MYTLSRSSTIFATQAIFSVLMSGCYGGLIRDAQQVAESSSGSDRPTDPSDDGEEGVGTGNGSGGSATATASAGSTGASTDSADTVGGTTATTGPDDDSADTTDGCDLPLIVCNGLCIDPQTDQDHCGASGNCVGGQVCLDHEACVDGACACVPVCTGRECGFDPVCGQPCGADCEKGSDCVDGQCECVPDCRGRECGPDDCGGDCGSCDAGFSCEAGECSCPDDTALCDGECIDVVDDVQNCGGCDQVCESGDHSDPICGSGECDLTCDNDWLDCNGDFGDGCEAKADHVDHCGSCETPCESPDNMNAKCDADGDAFECVFTCKKDFKDCNGDIVDGCEIDTDSDKNHCGKCNNKCDSDEKCKKSECDD